MRKRAIALVQKSVGRPTDYQPEFCERVIDHMSEGYPIETFASEIGVHRATLYNWAEKHSEFFDALCIGRERNLKWWIDKGRDAVQGKTPHFSASTFIFMMKNLHKFREGEPDPLSLVAARKPALQKKEMTEEEKLEYARNLRNELDEFIRSREPILSATDLGIDVEQYKTKNSGGK